MSAYIARGNQKRRLAVSKEFNIDNGAGTTDDDLLLYVRNRGITIHNVDLVYTEASDSGDASGANVKLGTSQGGAQIVAATNLGNAQAVATVTALTLAASRVEAGGLLWVRHTGIAATQVGKYKIVVEYTVDA